MVNYGITTFLLLDENIPLYCYEGCSINNAYNYSAVELTLNVDDLWTEFRQLVTSQ